ncbi:MAG: glycosyltransferase family 9 protein, partial [bacterium]
MNNGRVIFISKTLESLAKEIKQKQQNGHKLTREELFVLVLRHCYYEPSFPGVLSSFNLRPPETVRDPASVGILQLTKLGDVYSTFPLVSVVEEFFQPEEFVFYTDKPYSAAPIMLEELDRIVSCPVHEWQKQGRDHGIETRFIKNWVENCPQHDLLINSHDSLRSALLTELMDPDIHWGLRWDPGPEKGVVHRGTAYSLWKLLYPYVLEINDSNPQVLPDGLSVPQQTLTRFGFSDEQSYEKNGSFDSPEDNSSPEVHKVGCIIAGGWDTKRWFPYHWKSLFDQFLEEGQWKIQILGGEDVREIGEQLESNFEHVENHAGDTTLQETAEILKGTETVISNDTGPLHLAGWLGCPVVTLAGPTSIGSSGSAPGIMLQAQLDCIGCQ